MSKAETADSAPLFLLYSLSLFHTDKKFWGKITSTSEDKMKDTTEELERELVRSLQTLGRLYDQQAAPLQTASDALGQVVASVCHSFCFLVVGAGKAAACLLGGFSGGIFGSISALVWSDGRAGGLASGFLGSLLGGVAGGALGGTISSAVTILSKVAGAPVGDVTSDKAWLFGFAAGGVAGGAIGGPLGATGGALGGVLGAFWAVQCTVNPDLSIVRRVLERFKTTERRLGRPVSPDVTRCLGDFREAVKPLLEQLKYIQILSDKLASLHHVHAVATQTAAILDALVKMEAVIAEARRTDCLFELVSGVLAAAELSRNIKKELEGLRRSVETFPHQLSGTPEDLLSD